MPEILKRNLWMLFIAGMLHSCQCSGQERKNYNTDPDSKSNQEHRIDAQKKFLEKERNAINAYIKDRHLDVKRSGTGLYYQILEDSAAGGQAASGDEVTYDYDIYLMNGTRIYSSEVTGPKTLTVDREDAEIGVHESLKLLGVGDKGLFILPSHLAFGVAGDQNQVPPKTSLVYELKVTNIKSKTR